jgi:hypothetical protein
MVNAELKQADYFEEDDDDNNDSDDVEDVSVHGLCITRKTPGGENISTDQAFTFLSLDVKRQASCSGDS